MHTHKIWVKRFLLGPIRTGTKTVEIRANTGRFRNIRAGDQIVFNEDDRRFVVTVCTEVRNYRNLDALLEEIPAEQIWPGHSRQELYSAVSRFIPGPAIAFWLSLDV